MRKTSQRLLSLGLLILLTTGSYSQNYDDLIYKELHSQSPGGSVLIAKNGDIVYHKSYGKANIELDVNMINENVYRIASLSKQFTSIAILKLAEEYKLSIKDEITKFIPNYPTQGHRITLEHLLTHTSGIKDYLTIDGFNIAKRRQDMTPEELIDLFKNEPMDFEPGTQYKYSSSGYIILGYIIENLSGMSYEDYLQKNIFKLANLNNTRYGSTTNIIINRASGYKKGNDSYKNAEYLSMTLPYASGSLLSTTEDLFKWNKALAMGKIVSTETLNSAYKPYILKSSQQSIHGFGWEIGNVQGIKAVKHSGLINGFTTYALSVPEENTYVVILTNCENVQDIGITASKLAAIAIGKPYELIERFQPKSSMELVNGIYENEFGSRKIVRYEDQNLLIFDRGKTKRKLIPFNEDSFFIEHSLSTWSLKNYNNETYLIENNTNQIIQWKRIDSNVKSIQQKPIKLRELKKYIGKYELAPEFYFEVKIEQNTLIGQIRNDKKELIPIDNHQFIARDVDAKLTFNLENNNVVSLILNQGREMIAKKVE